jgi:hypothetical protein
VEHSIERRRQSFVERYVLARAQSINGTRAEHAVLIVAANEAFDMIMAPQPGAADPSPRVHYKRARMSRHSNLVMLAQRLTDAAARAGVQVTKFQNNLANEGVTPIWALATTLEALRDDA